MIEARELRLNSSFYNRFMSMILRSLLQRIANCVDCSQKGVERDKIIKSTQGGMVTQ